MLTLCSIQLHNNKGMLSIALSYTLTKVLAKISIRTSKECVVARLQKKITYSFTKSKESGCSNSKSYLQVIIHHDEFLIFSRQDYVSASFLSYIHVELAQIHIKFQLRVLIFSGLVNGLRLVEKHVVSLVSFPRESKSQSLSLAIVVQSSQLDIFDKKVVSCNIIKELKILQIVVNRQSVMHVCLIFCINNVWVLFR